MINVLARSAGAASRTRTAIAALVVAGAAALVPVGTATASGLAAGAGTAEGVAAQQRPRRWWLDAWCHSMQERLFVQWVNTRAGGTSWQFTMTPAQVNALYAWWLQAVWPTL